MSGDEKRARDTEQFLDNLTDFLSNEDASLEDIKGSLHMQGVDAKRCLLEFREILSTYAPTWREKAAQERHKAQENMSHFHETIRMTRDAIVQQIIEITKLIRAHGVQVEVGAYYRNLTDVTNEDLASLLEDLQIQRQQLLEKHKTEGADRNG